MGGVALYDVGKRVAAGATSLRRWAGGWSSRTSAHGDLDSLRDTSGRRAALLKGRHKTKQTLVSVSGTRGSCSRT